VRLMRSLTNRGEDHTMRYSCLGTFFLHTELGRNTKHRCLSMILTLNEQAQLSSVVYEFECCTALMCYMTVVSHQGGAKRVDDHACIFCRFSVMLTGPLLIDTFTLVVMRVINLCAELLYHTSAFSLHTL